MYVRENPDAAGGVRTDGPPRPARYSLLRDMIHLMASWITLTAGAPEVVTPPLLEFAVNSSTGNISIGMAGEVCYLLCALLC